MAIHSVFFLRVAPKFVVEQMVLMMSFVVLVVVIVEVVTLKVFRVLSNTRGVHLA